MYGLNFNAFYANKFTKLHDSALRCIISSEHTAEFVTHIEHFWTSLYWTTSNREHVNSTPLTRGGGEITAGSVSSMYFVIRSWCHRIDFRRRWFIFNWQERIRLLVGRGRADIRLVRANTKKCVDDA